MKVNLFSYVLFYNVHFLIFQVEKIRKKTVTPYILWASVMRKQIAQDNKDKGFGEVSRIVGEMVSLADRKWLNLVLFF